MPALISRMAYKGQTPWHGLGVNVKDTISFDEMVMLGGLNYSIELVPIFARTGEFNGGSVRKVEHIQDYCLVHSFEKNRTFQVAGPGYVPMQPKAVAEFFKKFCDAGDLELETVGCLKGFAINWCLAKTKFKFSLPGGDEVDCYYFLATGHDGSLSTVGGLTTVRIVCMNTLMAAMGDSKKQGFKVKHSLNSTARLENAKKVVEKAIEDAKKFEELANRLAETRIEKASVDLMVLKLTQKDKFKEIMEESQKSLSERKAKKLQNVSLLDQIAFGHDSKRILDFEHNRVGKAIMDCIANGPGSELVSADQTLWGVLNGVTYYTDHVAKSESRDTALTSAWFGPRANLKESALELCVEEMERIAA